MKLHNTSSNEDAILTNCESFGGQAAEAAEIARNLDEQLTEALKQVEELEIQTKNLENRLGNFEAI